MIDICIGFNNIIIQDLSLLANATDSVTRIELTKCKIGYS